MSTAPSFDEPAPSPSTPPPDSEEKTVVPGNRAAASPLVQHYWLSHQVQQNEQPHNLSLALQLQGIDTVALLSALRAAVAAHPQLLVRFEQAIGLPLQQVVCDPNDEIRVEDLTDLSPAEMFDRISETVRRRFDLRSAAALRIRIYHTGPNQAVLLLVSHRCVADKTTLTLLAQQVAARYRDPSRDFPASSSLPPTGTEPIDPKALQDLGESLVDLSGFLDLGISKARPSIQSTKGAVCERPIPLAVLERLHRYGQDNAATIADVLLCAYAGVLARYGDCSHVTLGETFSGRDESTIDSTAGGSAEGDSMWGCFDNPLPITLRTKPSMTFAQALQRVRLARHTAKANFKASFPQLLQALHPRRDPSYHPLFQVGFEANPAGIVDFGPKVECTRLLTHHGGASLDLTLEVLAPPTPPNVCPQEMSLRFEYCRDLFDATQIRSLLDHLLVYATAGCEKPDTPLPQLPLLTEAELHRQCVEWNNTRATLPERQGLHVLFEQQVEKTPDRIAVQFQERQLTYADLNRQANQIAQFLNAHGVGPDILVAVCLERSEWMLVVLLGILKAGGGYVPMDPAYPPERIQYMADHSRAPWLITSESLLDSLPKTEAQILCIDRDRERFDKLPDSTPLVESKPEHLAYVIYTSGSTGKPKGVQVPQGAAHNFIASMAKLPGMAPDDTLVAVTTLCFDIAVLELYLPLAVGARTVIASKQVASDGAKLWALMQQSDASILQATPATWYMLLAAGMRQSKLKALCGGEALPQQLAEDLLKTTGSLWNMYGPTETTVWSTCYQVTDAKRPLLVGRPIDNTTVYVLDEHLQPLPIGLSGELHIGGRGVTRGYLHRDDLTADRFIDDPFDSNPEARLYKTGDAARYQPDGNLALLHRLDNQVKVRGFRIELGEIESVLVQHEQIDRNVVVVREDTPGDKRIVCYFVPRPGCSPSETQLRQFAGTSLPTYMVPQHYVLLSDLPQTPNGKVDRKALPTPTASGTAAVQFELSEELAPLPAPQWDTIPVFRPSPAPTLAQQPERGVWWIFADDLGLAEKLGQRLTGRDHQVIVIRTADAFQRVSATEYCLNPEQGSAPYTRLVRELSDDGYLPNHIVHAWLLTGEEKFRPGSSLFYRNQEHGYQSLQALSHALSQCESLGRVHYTVLTNGAQSVGGETLRYPDKATVFGACTALRCSPQGHTVKSLDLDLPAVAPPARVSVSAWKFRARLERIVETLEVEVLAGFANETLALRARQRLALDRKPVIPTSDDSFKGAPTAPGESVHLITSALSNTGLLIAEQLVAAGARQLILVDRQALPPQHQWSDMVAQGDAQPVARLTALLAAGAQLEVRAVDPADGEAMRRLAQEGRVRFGSIDRVIHLAGGDVLGPRTEHTLGDRQSADQAAFETLVHGSRVIAQTFGASSSHPSASIAFCTDLHGLLSEERDLVQAAGCAYVQAQVQQAWAAGDRSCTLWAVGPWLDSADETSAPKEGLKEDSPLRRLQAHRATHAPSLAYWRDNASCLWTDPLRAVRYTSPISIGVLQHELQRACHSDSGNSKLAPRDEIEQTLLGFWRDVLGVSDIGVRDNFFEVGGHSLTAVRLFGEIQHCYEVEWPLAVLFEAPTIEACANRIRAELAGEQPAERPTHRFVVPMHPGPEGGNLPPFFVVAGAFGNVLNLRHLAQLMGKERAVYGVQAKGLNGEDGPHETFEQAARDYLEEIRTIAPQGPYVLGGFCSGGTIAYEMARQLEQEHQVTSHLVLLDSTAPTWAEAPLTSREKAQVHMERMRSSGASYPLTWIQNRFHWEKQLLKQRIYGNQETQSPALFRSRTIYDATMRAEARYNPGVYRGKTILLRPRLDRRHVFGPDRAINAKREFVRHDNGWMPHLPALQIREVAADPGDHDGFVLEPAVRDLVSQIRTFLAE